MNKCWVDCHRWKATLNTSIDEQKVRILSNSFPTYRVESFEGRSWILLLWSLKRHDSWLYHAWASPYARVFEWYNETFFYFFCCWSYVLGLCTSTIRTCPERSSPRSTNWWKKRSQSRERRATPRARAAAVAMCCNRRVLFRTGAWAICISRYTHIASQRV